MRLLRPRSVHALLVLIVAHSASAQIYVGTPTTISTDVRTQGGVVVGFNINTHQFSPTTLTVSGGGTIDFLGVYAGSTAINSGGDVGGVSVFDDSLVFSFQNVADNGPSPLPALLQINSGGFASLLCGKGPSVGGAIIINGGQTDSGAPGVPEASFYQAFGTGAFTLNNGQLNGEIDAGVFNARATPTAEAPTVNLNGGTLTNLNGASGNIIDSEHASVTLAGTAVSGGATLHYNATFTMTSGSLAAGLAANENSVATISGGTFNGPLIAADNSTVAFSTDIHGSVFTSGAATLTGSGATVDGNVTISNSSSSTISLASTLVVGDINVSGPVQLDLSGATVIGGNVTLNATTGLFLPNATISAEIKGGLTLAGFSEATLIGGALGNTIGADVVAGNASTLIINAGMELKGNLLMNDSSSLELNDGTIDDTLAIAPQCNATMSGGTVNLVTTSAVGGTLHDGFEMHGGTITTDLAVTGDGTFGFFSGDINTDLNVDDSAHAALLGPNANVHAFIRVFNAGSLDFLDGFAGGIDIEGGDGTVTLRGGTVFQNVEVNKQGSADPNFEFDGGLIGFDLNLRNASTAFMRAGEVADSVNVFSSHFILFGGKIDNQLIAHGSSIIDIEGGQIGKTIITAAITKDSATASTTLTPEIMLLDQSSLEIHGLSLSDSLLNPNFTGNLSEYSLTGNLADGTSLSGLLLFVQNPVGSTPGATFTLVNVPEPTTLLATPLITTLLLLRRRLPAIGCPVPSPTPPHIAGCYACLPPVS